MIGVHVLREEEDRETERRVLGVETADEFTLGLDDVKGWSIEFGGDRDDEDDEGHEAESDQVPVPDSVALGVDDVVHRQGPRDEHDRDDRHAERRLVTDHLGTRTH